MREPWDVIVAPVVTEKTLRQIAGMGLRTDVRGLYQCGASAMIQSKEAKVRVIANGVEGTKMKAFKGKLSDKEIAAVTAFVKTL